MNSDSLPLEVIAANVQLEVPMLYPWPLGIWAHASLLAHFVCNTPRYALKTPFIGWVVENRQRILKPHFKKDVLKYRKKIGPVIAKLIHLLRHQGLQLCDIYTIFLYALILLVRVRTYTSIDLQVCTVPTLEVWVIAAVKRASRILNHYDLKDWHTAILNPCKEALRSVEDHLDRALGPSGWISPWDFERAQQSVQQLGFFGRCAFEDAIPGWIFGLETKDSLKSVSMPAFRPSIFLVDSPRAVGAETHSSTCEQEQKEVVLRLRRDSMMSSSSCSVDIVTGNEDAIW